MNIEEIKKGFLTFYQEAMLKAHRICDPALVKCLEESVGLIKPVHTKSEFLQLLVVDATNVFSPMKDWLSLVCYLQEHFSEKDLRDNGIVIDHLPEHEILKGSQGLFINTKPVLCEHTFSEEICGAFLGRWLVDVYRADVVALDGAHINLRGPNAKGQRASDNASVMSRHDVYYQPVMDLNDKQYQLVERMCKFKQPSELLDEILHFQGTLQKKILLHNIEPTPITEQGDQLIAEDEQYVLILNTDTRECVLSRKLSEQQVIDEIRETKENFNLETEDLRTLHVCMLRDMFLKLPNERFEIGTNHLGQPASISFDPNKLYFNTHGLYYKNYAGHWIKEDEIYLRKGNTFVENVKNIQECYSDDLKLVVKLEKQQYPNRRKAK